MTYSAPAPVSGTTAIDTLVAAAMSIPDRDPGTTALLAVRGGCSFAGKRKGNEAGATAVVMYNNAARHRPWDAGHAVGSTCLLSGSRRPTAIHPCAGGAG